MRTIFLGILMLAGTCGSQKDKTSDTNYQVSTENQLMLVLSDNYGGTETEELLVIRDYKALNMFFTKVNMTRKPGLPVPEIDFNRSDRPAPDSNQKKDVSTAVLMPFHLYKMPLTEKEISLSKEE